MKTETADLLASWGELEWTIFDRHSTLREPTGPRWTVFETYNREPTTEFHSVEEAKAWLQERGFALGAAGTWIQPKVT